MRSGTLFLLVVALVFVAVGLSLLRTPRSKAVPRAQRMFVELDRAGVVRAFEAIARRSLEGGNAVGTRALCVEFLRRHPGVHGAAVLNGEDVVVDFAGRYALPGRWFDHPESWSGSWHRAEDGESHRCFTYARRLVDERGASLGYMVLAYPG